MYGSGVGIEVMYGSDVIEVALGTYVCNYVYHVYAYLSILYICMYCIIGCSEVRDRLSYLKGRDSSFVQWPCTVAQITYSS